MKAEITSKNFPQQIKIEINSLSRREKEILKLIIEGLQNKAIAKRLYISIKTVEWHKENLKQKLGFITINDLYNFDLFNQNFYL